MLDEVWACEAAERLTFVHSSRGRFDLDLTLSAIALSPVQWLKLGAFLAMASVPWTMYFAARNLFILDDSKHIVATAAAILGTVYWWNSLPREMFFYGMIGFPVASYLSILGVSFFYRLAAHPVKFGWLHLVWLIFAAAILPLHVQSIVIFLPPMIALILLRPRLVTPSLTAWIAGAVAFSLLINLAWLIPAFHHRTGDVSTALTEQLQIFVRTDPLIFVKDYLSTMNYWSFRQTLWEKGFRLLLLVLGASGIRKLISSDKRDLGIMLASALIILFLIAYFGALVPFVKAWQPLRFKVPFDLLLAISASYTVSAWLSSPKPSRSPLVPILAGLGLVTFLFNLAQTESTGRLQLRSRFIPELIAVIEWIGRETPDNARVLFEESGDESGFVYDRTYLSSFLPYMTGRQLIGAFGRRAEHGLECLLLWTFEDAPGERYCIEVFDDRDLMPCHRANILLRNLEFPEHVLIKRVINVEFDPVQPDHTLLEMSRQLPVDDRRASRSVRR